MNTCKPTPYHGIHGNCDVYSSNPEPNELGIWTRRVFVSMWFLLFCIISFLGFAPPLPCMKCPHRNYNIKTSLLSNGLLYCHCVYFLNEHFSLPLGLPPSQRSANNLILKFNQTHHGRIFNKVIHNHVMCVSVASQFPCSNQIMDFAHSKEIL